MSAPPVSVVASAGPGRVTGRRILLTASVLHFTNDACFALLYPLLPLIAADLHLSYTQVGLVRAVFSGAASVFQLPAGLLGERFGEGLVLLVGNAWVGGGVAAMALAGGYFGLLGLTLLAGLGGNAQHPLGAALVSRSNAPPQTATALGVLHFAGDLGKLVAPVAAGVAVGLGWRMPLAGVGAATAALAALLLLRHRAVLPPIPVVPRAAGAPPEGGTAPGFGLLLTAGVLDSATQGAALTFLPFLFARQGLDAARIGLLFGLIFAAGATGKFICGWLSDRWGPLAVIIATEVTTAAALLGFAAGKSQFAIPLAAIFGFALSGTASALATAVTAFVPAGKRARGYGAFFTAALTGGALAPLAYGLLGDRAGLLAVFLVMAALTVVIVPVVLPLRRVLATLG